MARSKIEIQSQPTYPPIRSLPQPKNNLSKIYRNAIRAENKLLSVCLSRPLEFTIHNPEYFLICTIRWMRVCCLRPFGHLGSRRYKNYKISVEKEEQKQKTKELPKKDKSSRQKLRGPVRFKKMVPELIRHNLHK